MIQPLNIQPEALPNAKVKCANCGTDLIFNDRYDTVYSAMSTQEGELVVYGYVECPICKHEVIVEMDGKWLADYYSIDDKIIEG